MRFKIHSVPTSQELLDRAFKTTRLETPDFSKRIRKKERWAKEIEKNKIETVARLLEEKLKETAEMFPEFDELPVFYRELADASIDISNTKKQLSNLKKKGHLVRKLQSQIIREIFLSKSISRIRKQSQSFYGRTASIIKKLDKELKQLEQKRKQLNELPNIRMDAFTVILAGSPNVGKTTLLKKLTNSEPRIAPFPFTTKGLKIGYFEFKYFPIQVIDTPGILDRPAEKRNPIEKKALLAVKHLGELILFLVDPSLSSGFSLQQQHALWGEIRSDFSRKTMIVVITKTDVCNEEQLAKANQLFSNGISSENVEEIKTIISTHAFKWVQKPPKVQETPFFQPEKPRY